MEEDKRELGEDKRKEGLRKLIKTKIIKWFGDIFR